MTIGGIPLTAADVDVDVDDMTASKAESVDIRRKFTGVPKGEPQQQDPDR
ncbi:hypothetical protein ACLMAL_38120 [Nocardia sp. CWNU-33]